MRWFKHMSDSLDDPFIHDLMDNFSHLGYVVWFGLIEIIAKENKNEITGKVEISPTYLRRKLRTSPTKLREVLDFCQTHLRLTVNYSEKNWEIHFPKMAEIKDNYTKDLQASCKKLAPYIEEEKEEEEEEEDKDTTARAREEPYPEKQEISKTSTGTLKQEEAFEQIWESLPLRNGKKLGQQETFRRFCMVPQDDWPLLIQAAKNYAASERVKDGIGILDPKNFIGTDFSGQPWKDWIEPEIKKKSGVDEDERRRKFLGAGADDG